MRRSGEVSKRHHLPDREPCPYLPAVDRVWTAEDMAQHRGSYDVAFYVGALSFAQSLWLEGKPAQSLLQMNKALMADLRGDEAELAEWPLPYAAKVWVMQRAAGDEFLGNPVRHYQHLATRMSGPRSELRTWRAWACFHLAERALDQAENPRDERQIEKEGVVIQGWAEVLEQLEQQGLPGERKLVEQSAPGKEEGVSPGN